MAKNALFKIISFISKTTNSTGKMILPTYIETLSITPYGIERDQFAIWKVLLISLPFLRLSFLKIESDIRPILEPRLSEAFLNFKSRMIHGIVKLSRFLSFFSSSFLRRELHSSIKEMVSHSSNVFVLRTTSLKKLVQFCILYNISIEGILTWIFLKYKDFQHKNSH